MQLGDIVRSIRRHWKVSVGLFAASILVLAIFLVTRNEVLPETEYQASVLVLIPAPDSKGGRPQGVPPNLLQGQVTLANSETTRTGAGSGLAADERDRVTYSAAQNSTLDIMTLSARAPSASLAEKAANSYATSYIRVRAKSVGSSARSRQGSLRSNVYVYRTRLTAVEAELTASKVNIPLEQPTPASGKGATTTTIVPESIPEDVALLLSQRIALRASIDSAQRAFASSEIQALTPSSFSSTIERTRARRLTPPAPSPIIPAGVALGSGLLLALGVPALMDRFDHTVRDTKTASAIFGAPVLTTIPALRPIDQQYLALVGSEQDRSYRSLAARSVATDRLPRAIFVTSPTGQVQNPVAANFANALATLGLQVALVATAPNQQWLVEDVDKPSSHSLTELLQDAQVGASPTDLMARLTPSDTRNLFLVPAGDLGNPPSLDGLAPLLAGLESAGIDVVVVAGAALLEDPLATIFAWTIRSVLWAIEIGEVTQADAQEAASSTELAGVSTFGIAMVGAPI